MRTLLATLCVSLLAASSWANVTAKEYYNATFNSHLKSQTNFGEQFCWYGAFGAKGYVQGYKAYGTEDWISYGEKYFDWLLTKLSKDPDGYEGWIGNTIGKTAAIKMDALVGDSILFMNMMDWAEVVKNDPKLTAKYGKKADHYVKMATRVIWEKWNHRGSYYKDGDYGSYRTPGKAIDIKTNKWVERPTTMISDNLNKHYDAGLVLVKLWRITGKPEYKQRVIEIFGRAKSMWRYLKDGDRVVWNFWMPHGPYDMDGTSPKSWVAIHDKRPGYQAGEVGFYREVYDSGLVFSKRDFEMIIRTNHWMIDNGYKSADGTSKAGTLWGALARMDKRIFDIALANSKKKNHAKNKLATAYLQNVVAKQRAKDPWARTKMKPGQKVEIWEEPLKDGTNIIMSQVIPSVIETANKNKVKLATATRAKGELTVELFDKTGKSSMGVVHKQIVGNSGSAYIAPKWDGTNPKTKKMLPLGEYRLKWSLNGESRIEKVYVKKGVKRAVKPGSGPLAKGETIKETFEGKMSPRWHFEGAAPSSQQAQEGKKSLKLINGQKAVLKLSDDDGLPLKVSMWVWDAGKKFGKKSNNGPKWGVVDGNGNKIVVSQTWRGYLNGDANYVWFNSGQNQFFTPNVIGGNSRKSGWNHIVFDLTDQSKPSITLNGKSIGVKKQWIPAGIAGVWVSGGSKSAGDTFLDNVEVSY